MVKTLPSNVGGAGLIPGWGDKIPQSLQRKKTQSIKQKQYCNQFNKDFKNGPHQKKKNLQKKKKIGWSEEVTFEQKTRGREGVSSVVVCDIQGGQFEAGRTARVKALRLEEARDAPRAQRPEGGS